jgi:ABC-2 type transport system ATP-binding protein
MRRHIVDVAENAGAGVLWTSHNMYEVAEVCDRVLFLSRGRILLAGEPDALVREHKAASLEDLFVTIANQSLEPAGSVA